MFNVLGALSFLENSSLHLSNGELEEQNLKYKKIFNKLKKFIENNITKEYLGNKKNTRTNIKKELLKILSELEEEE